MHFLHEHARTTPPYFFLDAERVRVGECVWLRVRVGECVELRVCVPVRLGVAVLLGERVGVPVLVGERDGVALRVALDVAETTTTCEGDIVGVRLLEGTGVAEDEPVPETLPVDTGVPLASGVPLRLVDPVGCAEREADGEIVPLGLPVAVPLLLFVLVFVPRGDLDTLFVAGDVALMLADAECEDDADAEVDIVAECEPVGVLVTAEEGVPVPLVEIEPEADTLADGVVVRVPVREVVGVFVLVRVLQQRITK